MKDFKLLLKNFGFWVIVYAFAVTVALIVVSISYHNYECETITDEQAEKLIQDANSKINQYEKQISSDSVSIWLSDRNERDSLRAIRFRKYTGQ